MKNVMFERSVLEGKIKSENVVSEDLETARRIARASSTEQDRVNFAKVKRILESGSEE